MRLSSFLALPFPAWDWQTHDCCRWVDRWVQSRGHGSPIAALGIQYDSERTALRRIAEAGGLVPLWTEAMARLGVLAVAEPFVGAVGVIQRATDCGPDEAVGIWTGERWVTLALRGLEFGPADALRVWQV